VETQAALVALAVVLMLVLVALVVQVALMEIQAALETQVQAAITQAAQVVLVVVQLANTFEASASLLTQTTAVI